MDLLKRFGKVNYLFNNAGVQGQCIIQRVRASGALVAAKNQIKKQSALTGLSGLTSLTSLIGFNGLTGLIGLIAYRLLYCFLTPLLLDCPL